MENVELGFAGLFKGFEVGQKFHMLGMYGHEYFTNEFDYDQKTLLSLYRNEIYELTHKDDERLVFVSELHESPVLNSSGNKIRYELDLESGVLEHYTWHKEIPDVYIMRQGIQIVYGSVQLVWIASDDGLTDFKNTRLKTLHQSFGEGMLIVPARKIPFEIL